MRSLAFDVACQELYATHHHKLLDVGEGFIGDPHGVVVPHVSRSSLVEFSYL